MVKVIEINEYVELNNNEKTAIITSDATKLFNEYVKKNRTIVALPSSEEEVKLTVEHNNCLVLILDRTNLTPTQINNFIEIYDKTSFSNEQRHIRRIHKMEELWKTF